MASRQQALFMIMVVSLAFATSTMTALRLPAVPIGMSELILLGCMLVHLPLGFGFHGGNAPNRFVPFLLLLFLAMLPGYFITLIEDGQVPFALYNLLASAWVVLVFAYVHFGFDHGRGELELLVRFFLSFSSFYFAAVLLLAAVEPSMVYLQDDIETLRLDAAGEQLGPVFRLVGFSTNPNQLALHAIVCAGLALQLWRRNGTMISLLCLGLAVACGVMAKSDAFTFAIIALVAVWITMGIVFNRSVVLGLTLIVPALATLAVFVRPIVRAVEAVAEESNQGSARLALWKNGLLAAFERPLVGLGPGAWSREEGMREFEEAHNSAIDYLSNAGLIGGTLLAIGLVALLWRTLAARQAAVLASAVSILLFATFHNVLRQPIMWLGVYYIAQHVWAGQRGSAVRSRGGVRRRARRPVQKRASV